MSETTDIGTGNQALLNSAWEIPSEIDSSAVIDYYKVCKDLEFVVVDLC